MYFWLLLQIYPSNLRLVCGPGSQIIKKDTDEKVDKFLDLYKETAKRTTILHKCYRLIDK